MGCWSKCRTRAAAPIKSIAADGPEVAILRGLHPHQPAQRPEAPFEHSLLPRGVSAEEQGVCQLGIVVTQLLFKPRPIRVRGSVEDIHQPRGERIANLLSHAVAAEPTQILMDADERECPGARRSKRGHHRQCLGEELSGHDLETSMRGASYAHAQRPERAGVTILRPLLIKPPAVETQEVMEPPGFVIKGVIQEGCVSGGKRPHACRFHFQLVEKCRKE